MGGKKGEKMSEKAKTAQGAGRDGVADASGSSEAVKQTVYFSSARSSSPQSISGSKRAMSCSALSRSFLASSGLPTLS